MTSMMESVTLREALAHAEDGDGCHGSTFANPDGTDLFAQKLQRSHIFTFVGKVTPVKVIGSLKIAEHQGVPYYLDGTQAQKSTNIINAAWWVASTSNELEVTMVPKSRHLRTMNQTTKK